MDIFDDLDDENKEAPDLDNVIIYTNLNIIFIEC